MACQDIQQARLLGQFLVSYSRGMKQTFPMMNRVIIQPMRRYLMEQLRGRDSMMGSMQVYEGHLSVIPTVERNWPVM